MTRGSAKRSSTKSGARATAGTSRERGVQSPALPAIAAAGVSLLVYLVVSFGLLAMQPFWLITPLAALLIGGSHALAIRASWSSVGAGSAVGCALGGLLHPSLVTAASPAASSPGWCCSSSLGLGWRDSRSVRVASDSDARPASR